jgi:hypothetical protein
MKTTQAVDSARISLLLCESACKIDPLWSAPLRVDRIRLQV